MPKLAADNYCDVCSEVAERIDALNDAKDYAAANALEDEARGLARPFPARARPRPAAGARMRIGSLFSGFGGLDLAAETVLGGRTAWQVEGVDPSLPWGGTPRQLREAVKLGESNRRILARHWPDAQRFTDVRNVGAHNLAPVDVLAFGFPCQDLSCAGSGKGLAGSRSGLFFEAARIVGELKPRFIIIENVPKLLKYRDVLERELADYALHFVDCYAANVGAPHLRRRVFVVGARDGSVVPGLTSFKRGDGQGTPLGIAVKQPWPTPTAGDAKASGSRSLASSNAHSGTSLTDAVRPDRAKAGQVWPTPNGYDAHNHGNSLTPSVIRRRAAGKQMNLSMEVPGRLNPDWVECLMGLPMGWTGTGLHSMAPIRLWPAYRDQEQHDWEPPRVVTGKPQRGRPARLRALGNGVVPQQAALAIRTALAHRPKQLTLV